MNKLELNMFLIDHEINKLVSKKNLIDIRLDELYQLRENLVCEWKKSESKVKEEW